MDAIVSIIGSLGFPIAMCVMFCYYIFKVQNKNNDLIDKLTTVVNTNTEVLKSVNARLDAIEKEIKHDNQV